MKSEEQIIEALREIWTPDNEIIEVQVDDAPQTELDSMIRWWFSLIVAQQGSIRLDLGSDDDPAAVPGNIRWEIVHGPAPKNSQRRREITIWFERAEDAE